MLNNYRVLAESVRERLNPEHLRLEKGFADELSTLAYSDVLTYIRLAMRGVENAYTQVSKQAGENVRTHLSSVLTGVVYRYQGSVMTNTHIKSYSDVDLLVIDDSFFTYEFQESSSLLNNYEVRSKYTTSQMETLRKNITDVPLYTGNALDELRKIRMQCEYKLADTYTNCDRSKPKSIKITNTDLRRDVDVVVSSWYDDVLSLMNNKGEFRGIQVYNKDEHSRGLPDYPFLSIDRINERGSLTVGRIKKMIRFLKNLKAKSDHDIKLSSFDFNAICYDIRVQDYYNLAFHELVPVLYRQLRSIANDKNHSDRLMSVDGREPIFRYNPSKLESLQFVLAELQGVYSDLIKEKGIY